MSSGLRIEPLRDTPETLAALGALLVEATALGASVSFLHPLAPERAAAFWRACFDSAARGGCVVLGALEGERLLGTVTLQLALPENQPHRAEVQKMLVFAAARRKGIGTALMRAVEVEARARRRSLLVLDTYVGSNAGRLYEQVGFTKCGEIPDFALLEGRLAATAIYWKRVS